MDFWHKSLTDAEAICRGIFNDALAIRAFFNGARDGGGPVAYRRFDIGPLQNVLIGQADGAKHYLILGRLRPNDVFDPSALGLMVGMAGDFSELNAFAEGAAKGEKAKPDAIRVLLDRILFASRMLAEMFHQAAAIAAVPGLSSYALVEAGVLPRDHFAHEELMRLELRHCVLVQEYRDALLTAETELRRLALEPAEMSERLNCYHDRERVMWLIRPEDAGGQAVNGVWIPGDCRDLVLPPPAKPATADAGWQYRLTENRQAGAGTMGEMGRRHGHRINRTTYWLVLVLTVGLVAILRQFGAVQVLGALVLFSIAIPRLHDIGRSAWIVVIIAAIEFAIGFVMTVSGPVPVDRNLIYGALGLVVLGLEVWLGCIPGTPRPNRWGAPPLPGLSYSKATT